MNFMIELVNENLFTLKIIFYALTMFVTLLYIFQIIQTAKEKDIKLGKKIIKKSDGLQFFYITGLKNNIDSYLRNKKKEKYSPFVLFITMVLPMIIAGILLYNNQYFLALLALLALYAIFYQVFSIVQVDSDDKIELELPLVIDTLIKSYSKEGDLKSVLFDVGRSVKEPFRTHFIAMSRKMITEEPVDVLQEFANEMDNIWIHSLVFILTSYQEEAKKEDIILNLRELSQIVEKENQLKRASSTDKQYSIVVNYVLISIAAVASVANIMYNPLGKYFFLETPTGLFIFLLGYLAIFITVISNLRANKKKKRK